VYPLVVTMLRETISPLSLNEDTFSGLALALALVQSGKTVLWLCVARVAVLLMRSVAARAAYAYSFGWTFARRMAGRTY